MLKYTLRRRCEDAASMLRLANEFRQHCCPEGMFCRWERAATSDSSDVRINHRADGARARGPRPEGPPEQNHIFFYTTCYGERTVPGRRKHLYFQ